MGKTCVVLGCSANKWKAQKKRISMFKVPENLERLEKWKDNLPALKETLTPECFVCEEHFSDTDFIKYSFEIESDGQWIPVIRLRLKTEAIPLRITNREDDFLSLYKTFRNAKSCESPCSCKIIVAGTSAEKCQSCIAKLEAVNSSEAENLDNESMKQSLLLKAIDMKREDVVKEMISLGTSLDTPGPDGRTALQIAIAKNNRDIIKLLVENGADIHLETKFGRPFAYAAFLGHADLLDYFMEKGVDANEKNQYGDTALHTMCKNEESIGSKETWSFLLKHGAHANEENLEKKTPSHYLSRESEHLIPGSCPWSKLDSALNLMSEFLNRGADLDDVLMKQPHILPYAVMAKCEKLTEYLCQRNVDVNQDVLSAFSSLQSNDVTPLLLAVESQNLNILKILVDHGARSKHPDKLLHFCVIIEFVDGLKFFLEKGMDANVKGFNDETPLHDLFPFRGKVEQLSEKKSEMCKLLLNHGASLEQTDRSGRTPLQSLDEEELIGMIDSSTGNGPNIGCEMMYRKLLDFAASEGHVTLLNSLLERGVDINGKNAQGETTLHFICKNCNLESPKVCTFLLSRGADVHAEDNDNKTPTFYASQDLYKLFLLISQRNNPYSRWQRNCEMLVPRLFLMHKLITQGADVNEALKECPILLHIAVIVGVKKLVKCLLERNVDVNSRTEEGATALHCAAYFDHYILVPILLRHGACINTIITKKLTPLHVAISQGHTCVALVLLNLGANINAQDTWGQTVFHLAANYQRSAHFPSLFLREADTKIKDMHGLTVHDIVSNPLDFSTKQLELSRDISAEREKILTGVFFKCAAVPNTESGLVTSAKEDFLSSYCAMPPGMDSDAENWSSTVFRRCLRFMESRAKILSMSEEQLTSTINANTNPMDTHLAQQMSLMRRTEVSDDVTLYDIATKHFRKMARCLGVTKIPDIDDFAVLGYYHLLHERISAVERQWAGNELGKSLKVTLPEEIIDEIMRMLNIFDVRNILNATVGYKGMAFSDDAYETVVAEFEAGFISNASFYDDDFEDEEWFYDRLMYNIGI